MKKNLKSDFELIALIEKGDRKALNELYDRYDEALFFHGLKHTGYVDDMAREAVQMAMISLWQMEKINVTKGSVVAYLKGMVFNKAKDLIGKEMKYPQVDIDDISNDQVRKKVREVQQRDPNNYKELLVVIAALLRARNYKIWKMGYDGYKNEEIAKEMNMSESRVADVRTMCKKQLARYFRKNGW